MDKNIIIINGSGGKGKDKFVEFCSIHIPTLNVSSVDKVKEAARILGWNDGKSEKDRLFLARLKFDSSDYNDNPFSYMATKIKEFKLSEYYKLMFLHIREPEEIDRIKKTFNCKTVLIKNINVSDIKSNEADANVYNYNYDYTIYNDESLSELENLAYKFLVDLNYKI